jgi:predicted transcriptional regulator
MLQPTYFIKIYHNICTKDNTYISVSQRSVHSSISLAITILHQSHQNINITKIMLTHNYAYNNRRSSINFADNNNYC